ncbi:CS1-pili formation C-terminal domain-containing protein [Aeromonas salmonicida]|uniref:fimbrial biogenesis outer membrane usher protein n=1 Tax=Aeromonas salmonicida TaxID=645 RepID=UPI00259DFB4C|nr:fimbrial biogenesis outer membrane usher protein [Aeromonas salmonicida]MDM5068977.1 CS1-pili formation C-terminal domain-containing protein [Aeromonas salmonicida]
MLKKACLLPAALLIMMSASASASAPLKIANVIIPASFASALAEGIAVPVRLQYQDQALALDTTTEESIGNATLILRDGTLHLLNLDFNQGQSDVALRKELVDLLQQNQLRTFSSDGRLVINDSATMQLDLIAMLLTIKVTKAAFSEKKANTRKASLTPSVEALTSVNRYNLGYSFANSRQANSTSTNFAQLNTLVGYSEHHLDLDGSLYNLGETNQNGALYRAMYERDIEDRRFAAGMVSTWDLQTLGGVSALNTGRIYGLSYGNQALSRTVNESESTTPIQVFMPSAGEVRVYRDGKLISLQNFSIGNHRIDTSRFPHGSYSVTVEIHVDGRLTESSNQRVTKLGNSLGFDQEWGWQSWGGMMETSQDGSRSPLLGLSLARTFETTNLTLTGYGFKDALVSESQASWQLTDRVSTQLQGMLASDASWRISSGVTAQVHDNVSLWLSQEKLDTGSKLTTATMELYTAGISINLGGWNDKLGSLSFNTTHDREQESDRSYIDYYQSLYTGRYGQLGLRTSLQSNSATLSGFNNKSITLDYSIPFDNLFNLGMSSNEQGHTTANLSYQKRMEGFINTASFNSAKVINGMENSNPSLSGTLGFENSMTGGTLTLGRSSAGDVNGNLMARGSIITTGDEVLVSSQNRSGSGLLIDTGMGKEGKMLARINGQEHSLEGSKTFVALSPFQEYEVELLNSKTTKDSYDISTGKQRYTLFPGNVARLDATHSVKEMVTVFGVIRAEDGSVIANARIDNHIGTTVTNEAGEFSLDVDKANPVLSFQHGNEFCEAELDLAQQSGAVWMGDVICRGLQTYAMARGYQ